MVLHHRSPTGSRRPESDRGQDLLHPPVRDRLLLFRPHQGDDRHVLQERRRRCSRLPMTAFGAGEGALAVEGLLDVDDRDVAAAAPPAIDNPCVDLLGGQGPERGGDAQRDAVPAPPIPNGSGG